MKKITLVFCMLLLCGAAVFAQTSTKPTLYHPEADAKADIEAAVKKAGASGKHVFLQMGGNWCSWCIAFENLVQSNDTLKTFLEQNYEVVHVNYSKENKNEAVFASLGHPERFGFPVFVILNEKGERIHTQNSEYLEEGKGHSSRKVLQFFKQWSWKAVNPAEKPE
ncbi:thioredoxin family protein [Chitinophaga sp. GCM10012297]|uniref:Thioredoxin family protein n=1 Tax=Chitinophaga chungangae TaxID=2821488 RepID=A0ABS3Y7W5_9BACT|nr:thioredoxin family protein [Chitinophaga chungangae]MBO9150767.1 thioredoxin family protein [Chitinophaga chungangae]